MGCRQTSNLLELQCNLFQLASLTQNCIQESLSLKLLSLILFILKLCFQSDFFRISSNLSLSFSLFSEKDFDFVFISGMLLEAFVFYSTPLLKMPVIRTPVLGQYSSPYPFFYPLSNMPQQTQSSLVRRPSPWYKPFSRKPTYLQVGLSIQNLPVLCPSLNSPFILVCQAKFISTPSPCLKPLQNQPQYILPSQKYKKPSQVRSLYIQNPKYMQFLYFLIKGDLITIPQEITRLAKNENIYEGVDFYEICFSFLQYSIMRFSLMSFIFLISSAGIQFQVILKFCLRICPTLQLFRGATTEFTSKGLQAQYWVEASAIALCVIRVFNSFMCLASMCWVEFSRSLLMAFEWLYQSSGLLSKTKGFFFNLSLSPTSIFYLSLRPSYDQLCNKKLLLAETTLFYEFTKVLSSLASLSFCFQT